MFQGHFIAEMMNQTGMLVSMDLVELNIDLGDSKESVRIGSSLICSGCGESLL